MPPLNSLAGCATKAAVGNFDGYMYNYGIMSIPDSLLNDFNRIPRDRPVALLMRHSARHPITDPARGFEVPLTEEGIRTAESLGALMTDIFPCGRLMSSPVGRCIATVEAIAKGAGWEFPVVIEERISHGFIEPAWDMYQRGEVNGTLPRPVMAALDLLLDHPQSGPCLDVMVTHDTVVGAMVGCLLGAPVLDDHWPGFLEGMFIWRENESIQALWRGNQQAVNLD
jgi:hypothetical protein